MKIQKTIQKIFRNNSVFFCCDIQDKYLPLIHGKESLLETAKMMMKAAKVFNIPVLVTEQLKKEVFGTTSKIIANEFPKDNIFFIDKTTFSMVNTKTKELLEKIQKKNVVLFGMETQICVQQTCLDLLQMNYNVYLLTDCISSRNVLDRSTALKNMSNLGAFLTTGESVILEILQDANSKELKSVIDILKYKRNLLTNL